MKRQQREEELTGRQIDAMTPAQRQKLFEELEGTSPEERWAKAESPSAAERRRQMRAAKGMSQPKNRNGKRHISITVEADLLRRAEDFSRRNHMKRSELFTLGLQKVLAEGAWGRGARRPGFSPD